MVELEKKQSQSTPGLIMPILINPTFPALDDQQKNLFDAYNTLYNNYWAEFKEKTQLEWKLSISLWTAIIAGISASLANESFRNFALNCPWYFMSGFGIVLSLFCWFSIWIQVRLGCVRHNLALLNDKMKEIDIGLNFKPYRPKKRFLLPTPYIQCVITFIFLVIFWLIIYNK